MRRFLDRWTSVPRMLLLFGTFAWAMDYFVRDDGFGLVGWIMGLIAIVAISFADRVQANRKG